jgi:hypothetical protein
VLPYFEADTPFELKLDSIGNDHRDETVSVGPYLLPPEVEALTVKTTLRAEKRDALPARLLLRYQPFDIFHVPHRRPFFKNDGAVLAAIDGGRYLGVGGRIPVSLARV